MVDFFLLQKTTGPDSCFSELGKHKGDHLTVLIAHDSFISELNGAESHQGRDQAVDSGAAGGFSESASHAHPSPPVRTAAKGFQASPQGLRREGSPGPQAPLLLPMLTLTVWSEMLKAESPPCETRWRRSS